MEQPRVIMRAPALELIHEQRPNALQQDKMSNPGDGSRAILGGVGLNTVFYVFLYSVILIAIVRFGLLVTATGLIVDSALTNVPFPAHLSGWAGMPAVWTIIAVLGLMSFGFYAARAGQPLFGDFDTRS